MRTTTRQWRNGGWQSESPMASLRTANRQDGEPLPSLYFFIFRFFQFFFRPSALPRRCARPSLALTRISWSWPTSSMHPSHYVNLLRQYGGYSGVVWYLCVCYLPVLLVSLIILSPCSWLRDPLKHADLPLVETYSCHRHGIAEQGSRARTIGLSARVRRELPRWTRTRASTLFCTFKAILPPRYGSIVTKYGRNGKPL
ncbi:hypothetical protein F4860DRAFT_366374 [Xylaria cubensis]|nr:hypothetical protein F4860DRAFT_366374 [Xylaria cubensis]